jgi:tetratricopeptide (TPR) repeat protein
MVDQAPLGVRRQMSGQAFSRFAVALNRYLQSATDLPADVREPADDGPEEFGDDLARRAKLIAALRDPAVSGGDRGEPSPAALADLIHDTSFIHAVRLLHMEQFALAVDTAETQIRLKPILKGHRYELFAGVFVRDQMAAAEALRTLQQTMDRDQLELPANTMLDVFKTYQSGRDTAEAAVAALGDVIVRHGNRVYGDLAGALRIHASEQVKRDAAAALREVSPGSPLGIAAAIRYDWDKSQTSAADWEREFPEDLAVLGALADRYTALDRYDDAVRYRKKQLEFLPDQTVFQALARLYKSHDDERLWFQTLTASLEAPAYGLEHPHTHADLADYHMRRKEWDLARPHAEAAAAAYSARGLLCAADFFERTGDWRRAEAFHRANTERYASHGADLDWYRWCRRTGHGDVAAARALAQTYLDKLKDWPSAEARDTVGTYFVLEDQPAEALQAFRAAAGFDSQEGYHSLHAALLADELGDAPQRDELLKEAHTRGLRKNGSLVEIVCAFRNALDGRSDRLDLPVIDWVIRDRSVAGNPTNEFYFVGKFLTLHGRVAEGREYLQLAATSPMTGKFNATLAAYALVKAGVTIAQRRNDEFDDEMAARRELLQKANRLYNGGKKDAGSAAYEALIDAHPDFADARFARSMAFRLDERLDEALADLTRAHELIPGCPRFLVRRGEVLEYLGRYAAAIDDYQAALAIDPLNGFAHYNLAFLCAACPEASFRDGARAQEHARKARELSEAPHHLALALLAAASAEAGDFDQAARLQTESMQVAPFDAKAQSQERLQLFQRREPYHRRPGWWKKP